MVNRVVYPVVHAIVVGYKTSWNVFSHDAYVVVRVDDQKVTITIDSRQLPLIRNEYPPDSVIPIGYHDGKWNVESKPSPENEYRPEDGASFNELLDEINKAESA